ncbi:MAG: hemerythrin domain-containing protein [Chloroflexi bacterium]|nr:hemerythrin domain-containing protein [Chloroflexota bacterium]MBI4267933.1 hemerythrin domain-containing protein [Chloroflexota bacterium]
MTSEVDKIELDLTHPIGILMGEHDIILQTLGDLRTLIGQVGFSDGPDKVSAQLHSLKALAECLLDAEPHHLREEEVIFPRLEWRGITGPTEQMRREHEELRAKKRRLLQLSEEAVGINFLEFAGEVKEVGGYIVDTLEQHINKENNVLYRIALRDFYPDEWSEVMAEFNEIGYCCFTPQLPGAPRPEAQWKLSASE